MKVAFAYLFCTLALVILSGCSAQSSTVPPKTVRTATDDLGRTVTVPLEIRRIVSLAPNLTEMVYAAGAGDRLVGVTTYCNYPAEALEVAKIGDTMNPNGESIVALKPDIVLVSTASQIENFARVLDQNGIAVYVTNPLSLEDVLTNLVELGELLGTQMEAMKLAAHSRARIESLGTSDTTDRPKVFVQISKDPLFAVGRESFVTELVSAAGGMSVTADVATAYPKLNPEAAAAYDPDVIILSDSEGNREPNAAFKNSKAVRNRRVYGIDADLLSRPGPRLVDGLEQLAEKIRAK